MGPSEESPRSGFDDLARRLAALETDACREFADIFTPALVRFFVRGGLDLREAEQLACSCISDVAMKVRTSYRPQTGGSFQAWVYKIARNRMTDWHRQRRREAAVPLDADLPAPEEQVEAFQSDLSCNLAVQAALRDLPELDREILERRVLGGAQTFEEIAAGLGIRTDAARQRYRRALRRITQILGRDSRLRKYHEKMERRSA